MRPYMVAFVCAVFVLSCAMDRVHADDKCSGSSESSEPSEPCDPPNCGEIQNITIPAISTVGSCLGKPSNFLKVLEKIKDSPLVKLLGINPRDLYLAIKAMDSNVTDGVVDLSTLTCPSHSKKITDCDSFLVSILKVVQLVKCLPLKEILSNKPSMDQLGDDLFNVVAATLTNFPTKH